MIYVLAFIGSILLAAFVACLPFFALLFLGELGLDWLGFLRGSRFLQMMLKNLRRNLLRTSLTYLATFVLVFVVTAVWSVLYFIDHFMAENTKGLKVIITEKWQVNSKMPFAYADSLSRGAANPLRSGDVQPQDSMTWQFYQGTLDPNKQTRENLVICIAMEPRKLLTIMDDIWEELSTDQGKHRSKPNPEQIAQLQALVAKMEANKRGLLIGSGRLAAVNKQVGDRLTLHGMEFKDIDLEFEILGVLPKGKRYSEIAIMNRDYLNDALDSYPRTHGGVKHPLADKSLSMVWLQVADPEAFGRIAEQIDSSGLYQSPAVKCQTLSAEIAARMDANRDLIWGMRWLLSPAIVITMALVLSNAISISVRERRMELAVLKVLGFRPGQILTLVLGEALLIGTMSGLFSASLCFVGTNWILNNLVDNFIFVPEKALAWGSLIGAATALAGSLVPGWSACTVKVSEVFARVT